MAKEYIEREAAKRELLSWAVSINHPEYLIKDDALHVIDSIPAADVVEQEQESKPLNGWISVKDRLPDYFTSVLVWCPGNKCIYAAYRNARQEWYTFDDTIAGHVVVNMVTHWMPMPEPPEAALKGGEG